MPPGSVGHSGKDCSAARERAGPTDRFGPKHWRLLLAGSWGLALFLAVAVAPTDAVQGEVQRLMYVHVPSAWTAFLCYAAVLLASIWYLLGRDSRWDRRAQASAEVGVVLTALTLVTGGIWGSAAWGTAWAWDARIVSTAVLLLVYVGYLAVRAASRDVRQGARLAALIGIAGFVLVPIVHFSVLWFRTLHQPPTLLAPNTSPPIDGVMALALGASMLAFMLLAAWTIRRRYRALEAAAVAATAASADADAPTSVADHNGAGRTRVPASMAVRSGGRAGYS